MSHRATNARWLHGPSVPVFGRVTLTGAFCHNTNKIFLEFGVLTSDREGKYLDKPEIVAGGQELSQY